MSVVGGIYENEAKVEAVEKPPKLRVVATFQIIEVTDRMFGDAAGQLEWNVRRVVVPVARLMAFDFNGIAQDMLTEVVDMRKE